MGKVKKVFAEFKSIFFSENVLKENEYHANIVVATTMFNLFIICIISFILVSLNVFKLGIPVMAPVVVVNFFLLFVPAIICFAVKANKKWMRIYLFTCFVFAMAIADAMLKYNVTLLMVLPLILAARYYNKRFTIWVVALTFILFGFSTRYGMYYGQQDLNSYNLIIPHGTTITIDSTLRDAVTNIEVDEAQRARNIYIHFYLPKLFLFSMISFACVQIAQSGKKMIEKQIEITEKSSRLNTELDLAYNIQQGMLPSKFPAFPEHDEIDIYAISKPAKEVGGDFYNMFLIDDNHLALCMADVSGKGVPAALFMMISDILIKVIADEGGNVDEVITRVNDILSKDNKLDIFVTAWFGILDLQTGMIDFVNAGHNPPLVYSKQKNEYEYLKSKANFVVAGMENISYKKSQIKLEPGDKLFLYTDGVVEAQNGEKEMYTEKRLKDFLDSNASLSVKETIEKLRSELSQFVGKSVQFDDITMLELLYKGSQSCGRNETKEFKTDVKELPNVFEFVNSRLELRNVDKKSINQIDLAVEEIFVNVVNYAYDGKEGICYITIRDDEDKIEFVFEDNGVPFNPLEQKTPDISLSSEEREVGGLGIFLVKKVMDKVEYKYENNKNILKITKFIK